MYKSEVERRRNRGRPCARWKDGVKKACNARALELSDAKVKCMHRAIYRNIAIYSNKGVDSSEVTIAAALKSGWSWSRCCCGDNLVIKKYK